MVHTRLRSSETAAADPFQESRIRTVTHARIYPLHHPTDLKDVTGGSLKCRLYLIITASEMGIPMTEFHVGSRSSLPPTSER